MLYIYVSLAYICAINHKDYDEAITCLKKAITLNSQNHIMYILLGNMYAFNIENYNEAINCYNKVLDGLKDTVANSNKDTISFVYSRLSYPYMKLKKYDRAMQYLYKHIEFTPNDYMAYYNLSWCGLFCNKYSESISAAKKVLDNTKKESVISNLALGYLLNNQYEEAEKIYSEYKGKTFKDNGLYCAEVFLNDIKQLEDDGIKNADFDKVKTLLLK